MFWNVRDLGRDLVLFFLFFWVCQCSSGELFSTLAARSAHSNGEKMKNTFLAEMFLVLLLLYLNAAAAQ